MVNDFSRINPNTHGATVHFVFKNYVLVATSDSRFDGLLHIHLANFLDSYGVYFPDGANYLFMRTELHEFKIREFGAIVNVYIKFLNYGKKN